MEAKSNLMNEWNSNAYTDEDEVMEKGCDDSTVVALSMKQGIKVLLLVKSQSIQSILGRI